MCHFYSLRSASEYILRAHRMCWQARRFHRIGPGEQGQIVRGAANHTVEHVTWGFRPDAADRQAKPLVRGEIAAERTMTAAAFRHQRCLVLADGFYLGRGEGPHRRYYFFQRPNAEPFAFAGIWTSYPERRAFIMSFAILTCPANGIVSNVHERMPAILGEGFHDAWLDESYNDVTALKHMLRPWSDRLLQGWEVRADLPARSVLEYDMADPIGPKLRPKKRTPHAGLSVM